MDEHECIASRTAAAFFLSFSHEPRDSTDVWHKLISRVQTKYVYVARDVFRFTKHTRLDLLVERVTSVGAMVVSGAVKDWHTGVVGKLSVSAMSQLC